MVWILIFFFFFPKEPRPPQDRAGSFQGQCGRLTTLFARLLALQATRGLSVGPAGQATPPDWTAFDRFIVLYSRLLDSAGPVKYRVRGGIPGWLTKLTFFFCGLERWVPGASSCAPTTWRG